MHKGAKVTKYLQAPKDYEVSEPVNWNDLENMRLIAITMVNESDPAYEAFKQAIKKATLTSVRKFFRNNGFTFVKNNRETTNG